MTIWIRATLWLFGANLCPGAPLILSGADAVGNVDTNWPDGTPAPGNNIYFLDQGIGYPAGVINNIVDGNRTILSLPISFKESDRE